MPPKAKKLTPKQIIANLEADLAALRGEKISREKSLLDSNFGLVTSVQQLRDLCSKQQKEFDVQHEVLLKGMQSELDASKSKVQALQAKVAELTAAEMASRNLHEEKLNLLRQVADIQMSRDDAEKAHAEEMHSMQTAMDNTKSRLEKVFSETLRTAVADEKRRLAVQLDAEATAALAEVGQLRILSSTQARQIAQLLKALEDSHRETDRVRKESDTLSTQLVSMTTKYESLIGQGGVSAAQLVADVNRWKDVATNLHAEVASLRSRLAMAPPPPLPSARTVVRGRSPSPTHAAGYGHGHGLGHTATPGMLSPDPEVRLASTRRGGDDVRIVLERAAEAAEHAVAAGHVRASSARRGPGSSGLPGSAAGTAHKPVYTGIAADVENRVDEAAATRMRIDYDGLDHDHDQEDEDGQEGDAGAYEGRRSGHGYNETKEDGKEDRGRPSTASSPGHGHNAAPGEHPAWRSAQYEPPHPSLHAQVAAMPSMSPLRATGAARPMSAVRQHGHGHSGVVHTSAVTPSVAQAMALLGVMPQARPASATVARSSRITINISPAGSPPSRKPSPPPSRLFAPGSGAPIALPVSHEDAVAHVGDDLPGDAVRKERARHAGYLPPITPGGEAAGTVRPSLSRPGSAAVRPSSAATPVRWSPAKTAQLAPLNDLMVGSRPASRGGLGSGSLGLPSPGFGGGSFTASASSATAGTPGRQGSLSRPSSSFVRPGSAKPQQPSDFAVTGRTMSAASARRE